MKTLMNKLISLQELTHEESYSLMDLILNEEVAPEQIGFILASYEFRTPTGTELAGFVQSLLKHSKLLDNCDSNVVDVCGTGGDGLGMFNVSTCTSFVVAGAGIKVAKHGNRAVSSKCGSFDVLEALNIPFCHGVKEAQASLAENNLAFLFAPSFHPILGVLATIRRNLKVRTLLNALGPLLNPARVKRQLIGVYSPKLLRPMAEALRILGAEEALIVHGEDGNDEISLVCQTRVAHLKEDEISEYFIDPRDYGFTAQDLEEVKGGSVKENADILLRVLKGERGPCRDMTLLNAGAALMIGGIANDLAQGISLATESIDSGKALRQLVQTQNLKAEEIA